MDKLTENLNKLKIIAQHQFTAVNFEDKTLREQLKAYGVDSRRLSRFTQLALLGALPLREEIIADTNIYCCSEFNSPSKFYKMYQQLEQLNQPSPLDFIANINNVVPFQLSQLLGTTGCAIQVVANEAMRQHPLCLALNDLMIEPYKMALIGWVFENAIQGEQEGSEWWLVRL